MDDVLIVGGGVVGLSLAWELAGRGARVVVAERQTPGREASWAGAGILPPAVDAEDASAAERLTALSHRLHATWAAELRESTGIDTGYVRCGGIYLARDEVEKQFLEAAAELCARRQIECRRLTADELTNMEPSADWASASPQLEAAWWLPDECQIRNPRHLRALLVACQMRGVRVLPETEVLGFDVEQERVARVRTAQGTLAAAQICVTSGPWTRRLLEGLGVPTAIRPVRGQIALFGSGEPVLRRIVNEGPRYLVPRPDGRILVGSTEEDVGFDKRTTVEGIEGLLRFAIELVPGLRRAKLEQSWAGLRPATVDGLPYLGAVPGYQNLFVAAGHFRSGLHQSPGTAVVMSQLMRGERPAIDLTAFRLERH